MLAIKTIRFAGAVTAMASLLTWSQVSAEEPRPALTVGGSHQFLDDDRALENEQLLYWAIQLPLDKRWAGEFRYAFGDGEGTGGNPDGDMVRWNLSALYHLYPNQNFQPYLSLGVGRFTGDYKTSRGKKEVSSEEVVAGVGAHFFMGGNLSLRGDARYIPGFDDRTTSDFTVSLGLTYHIGEASFAPRRVDSDGDGVYDHRDDCPGTPPNTRVNSRGCELRGATRVASIKLLANFGFDKDEVEERYFSEIGELAAFLKRFPNIYVGIEGHTDSVGPAEYNQILSERRARAVMEVLVNEFGIPPRRMMAKGFGESQPTDSNATREGRARNRRVIANLEVEYEDEDENKDKDKK